MCTIELHSGDDDDDARIVVSTHINCIIISPMEITVELSVQGQF